MNVTLPPDLQAYIEELVESGEFDGADAVMAKALRFWRTERQKVLDLVQEGIDSADRGDLRDGPEFMRELMARYSDGVDRVPEAA